jgi:hypothetical protein
MTVYVVSGLPRSGTSMLMQMLEAGGCPVLTDEVRSPDPDNPRGYYEFEPVKALARDPLWVAEAEGKAVKIVVQLLKYLPEGHQYELLLISRDMEEIMASQGAMLERLNRTGGSVDKADLEKIFTRQFQEARDMAEKREDIRLLTLEHRRIIEDPAGQAGKIADFLSLQTDAEAMAAVVDPGLHRQKSGPR